MRRVLSAFGLQPSMRTLVPAPMYHTAPNAETKAVVACDTEQWLAHPGTAVGEVYLSTGDAWPDFTYIGQDTKRREIERDGYLTLGDIGRLDSDGFLYLSNRVNDMVISGGVNIYPTEIEQSLIGLPGVRDVAVFGIPDPDYGESLAAHVDTDPGSSLTEDDIREHVRAHLAGYEVPKVVVLDRDLPREESGKLFRRRIRDRYLNPAG